MPRYREWDLACKVYVGNLGSSASKYEIENAFRKYGSLRNVWVARNPPGFAFVEFEDRRDAEDATRGLDGTRCCGTRIRVEMSSGRSRRDDRRRGGGSGGGGAGGGGGGGSGGSSSGRGGRYRTNSTSTTSTTTSKTSSFSFNKYYNNYIFTYHNYCFYSTIQSTIANNYFNYNLETFSNRRIKNYNINNDKNHKKKNSNFDWRILNAKIIIMKIRDLEEKKVHINIMIKKTNKKYERNNLIIDSNEQIAAKTISKNIYLTITPVIIITKQLNNTITSWSPKIQLLLLIVQQLNLLLQLLLLLLLVLIVLFLKKETQLSTQPTSCKQPRHPSPISQQLLPQQTTRLPIIKLFMPNKYKYIHTYILHIIM